MYTKKNTRVTFRSNRRSNFKRNNSFSNGKSRNKGNVTQQYNKYLKLAKEAFSSGDRIQSEYYYQFTDHYYRLMLELGINLEEDNNQEDKSLEDLSVTTEDIQTKKENNKTSDEKNNEEIIELNSDKVNEDLESIESVPFISEPVKKKATRSKKASI